MPASLSSLVPLDPAPPAAVVEAREKAVELQQRLLDERQAAREAAEQLLRSEKADREAMAHSFATGQNVSSDERGIEKARRARDTATRRAEAAAVAAQDAETRTRDEIGKARDDWIASAREQAAEADKETRAALRALNAALERGARAAGVIEWLSDRGGFDHERPARASLGSVAGTEKWTANSDPISWATMLHELDGSLAEPRPPEPVEARPLQPYGQPAGAR